MDKYKKNRDYRRRCRLRGCCPHCGQPCAPYTECETRRLYKAALRREGRRFNRAIKPTDPRLKPRGPIRLWTVQEESQLVVLIANNVPLADICSEMGRSAWAIAAHSRKLNMERFAKCDDLLTLLSLVQELSP